MARMAHLFKSVKLRWLGAAIMLIVAAVVAAQYWRGREPEVAGGPPTARLIGTHQYVNAIHDVFGEDIRVEANFALPQRKQGLLALGAANAMVTPGLLGQFDASARGVAAQVMDGQHRLLTVPCTPHAESAPDDRCAGQFFSHVGHFLFRRPLAADELAVYVTAAHAAATTFEDFYNGLAQSLAAMLSAPQFLYFIENTESDPEHPGRLRLDGSAKATRLSLFLWDSLPDAQLLQAAESGALHERPQLKRQVERMLAAPQRLERSVRAFFDDFLLFDRFTALSKDPVIYPGFTPLAIAAAREQALRLITDHLLTRRGDYRDLFTTTQTFTNEFLAPLQHLPVSEPDWTPVTLDASNSAGVLTSLGFLAVHSHPGRSSPTLRGRAIREAIMCQRVPDPPANVNFNNFEASIKTVKTARERLGMHATDPACSGCHKVTDPMGLALENFDGGGQFRRTDNGAPIDATGNLDGKPFTDAVGLGHALREHPAIVPCVANRLYAQAIGRETVNADRPWLGYIVKQFAAEDYRLPDLMRGIATSRAFYAVTSPSGGTETAASYRSTSHAQP